MMRSLSSLSAYTNEDREGRKQDVRRSLSTCSTVADISDLQDALPVLETPFTAALKSAINSSFVALEQSTSVKHTPQIYWPEVFSAVTMLAPSLYGLSLVSYLLEVASFPHAVKALLVASCLHCPVSMAYHFTNAAWQKYSYDMMLTPFRLADVVAIHISCIVFGWALSHGSLSYTCVGALVNLFFIARLVREYSARNPGTRKDVIGVAICVLIYTAPMLLRGDISNYFGAIFFFVLACVCHASNDHLHDLGHGFFHLFLVPYFHFLLASAAAPTVN
jgi:hypothetical protein